MKGLANTPAAEDMRAYRRRSGVHWTGDPSARRERRSVPLVSGSRPANCPDNDPHDHRALQRPRRLLPTFGPLLIVGWPGTVISRALSYFRW